MPTSRGATDCLATWCCEPCALCQELNEQKLRALPRAQAHPNPLVTMQAAPAGQYMVPTPGGAMQPQGNAMYMAPQGGYAQAPAVGGYVPGGATPIMVATVQPMQPIAGYK